ncbi:MAG TPA: ABC transporter substrate-binding protein [Streptosporangiaceae bacterium]|jgi:ribose transport system substrate-binding protein
MSPRFPAQLTGVAVIAVAALGLAACSSSGSNSGSKSSSSGKKTMQLTVGNASDPFYVTMECGAEQEAAKLGVKLTMNGPAAFDVPQQKPFIDNAEVTKPNALLVAPTDTQKLDSDMQRVQSNGTKLIFVDTSSSNTSLGQSRISSNNAAGGQLAADNLGKLLGGKGMVAVISMAKGTSTTDARVQGFEQEMSAKYPGISLLPEQNDVAATTTAATTFIESDITAHPTLSGVFTANTVTAQGTAAGLQHAGKAGRVKMVTFDAEPAEVQMLKSNVAQLIIAQEPAIEGADGVQQAMNAIEGKPVTASIPTPLIAISSQNLSSTQQYIYKASTSGC